MANLTKDRNTLAKTQGTINTWKLAASAKIYAGSMVAINTAGYAVRGVNTADFRIAGRAEEQVDNSTGSAGDKSIRVEEGVYKWNNATAGDAVTQAEIGHPVYVLDDNTVTKTAGNGVVAGIALQIDDDGGIWVKTFLDEPPAAA
jgi:hypothetical protein